MSKFIKTENDYVNLDYCISLGVSEDYVRCDSGMTRSYFVRAFVSHGYTTETEYIKSFKTKSAAQEHLEELIKEINNEVPCD